MPVHPIESYARQAYAAGWAASGGPMTARVRAGCAAAVTIAVEHADSPRILEVTLDLGRLEGMWANLFARREALIDQYTATVTAAWQPLLRPRKLRDAVHRLRADLGLRETDQDDQAAIRAVAASAARSVLQELPLSPGWATLTQALRNALAAGRADGIVAAVATAAHRAARDGLDWDEAFAQAYQQLERLGSLWSDADTWTARLIARAETDLAQVLADQAEAGVSHGEMLDAATAALHDGRSNAVRFIVDWAMTSAAGSATLATYQAQGARTVDWITAGDGRVCATCDSNESGSPWPIDQVPEVPAHPLCRCVLSAAMNMDRFDSWFTT